MNVMPNQAVFFDTVVFQGRSLPGRRFVPCAANNILDVQNVKSFFVPGHVYQPSLQGGRIHRAGTRNDHGTDEYFVQPTATCSTYLHFYFCLLDKNLKVNDSIG